MAGLGRLLLLCLPRLQRALGGARPAHTAHTHFTLPCSPPPAHPPPAGRLVDEYTKGPDGVYNLSRHNVEFSQYMRDNGYHIIPIKPKHQLVRGAGGAEGGRSGSVM